MRTTALVLLALATLAPAAHAAMHTPTDPAATFALLAATAAGLDAPFPGPAATAATPLTDTPAFTYAALTLLADAAPSAPAAIPAPIAIPTPSISVSSFASLDGHSASHATHSLPPLARTSGSFTEPVIASQPATPASP